MRPQSSAQSIIVIIRVRYSYAPRAGIIAAIATLPATLYVTIDKEAAMVISLLLMALQDAWLNIGLSKASGQVVSAPNESPDQPQR